MEVGPWRVDGKGGFNVIKGGWEEYTTMVYGERWLSNLSVWRIKSLAYSRSTCWYWFLDCEHRPLYAHISRGGGISCILLSPSDTLSRLPFSSWNSSVIFMTYFRNTELWMWVYQLDRSHWQQCLAGPPDLHSRRELCRTIHPLLW